MTAATFAFSNDLPDEGDHFAGPGAEAAATWVADDDDAIHAFTTPYAGRLFPRDAHEADLEADIGPALAVPFRSWPAKIDEGVAVTLRVVFGAALAGQPVGAHARFLRATGFEPTTAAPAGEIPNPRKITFTNSPPS